MTLSNEILKQYKDATDPFMRAVLNHWYLKALNMEEVLDSRARDIIERTKQIQDLNRELHKAIQDPESQL